MEVERPFTIQYRSKRLPGMTSENYGNWCTWKDYRSCELAQQALQDLRDKYDFYVFRIEARQTGRGNQ